MKEAMNSSLNFIHTTAILVKGILNIVPKFVLKEVAEAQT